MKAIVFTSGKDRVFCVGREHLHARQLERPRLQGQLLQVHQRDAALPRGAERRERRREPRGARRARPPAAATSSPSRATRSSLADDGSSAVSFPEAPLLGVLPGTGGLTRLVDKRKVRRDLADVFSTMAEGVRGKRALEWGLVDEAPARREFERGGEAPPRGDGRAQPSGGPLQPIDARAARGEPTRRRRRCVAVDEPRRAWPTLTMSRARRRRARRPRRSSREAGSNAWAIRAWRELDDALLDLRFNHPAIGVVALKTSGRPGARCSPSTRCSPQHRGRRARARGHAPR